MELSNAKEDQNGLLALLLPVIAQYNDVIMSAVASQITSLTIVYWSVYSGADQRKHQSSASLAFVGGIHRWPVNSPHKGPVTRKMFPFDDVIMRMEEEVDRPYFSELFSCLINGVFRCYVSDMTY